MARDLSAIRLLPTDSIRDAIACVDRGRCGIAIVVDTAGRLVGTITDGDVRRAMLASVSLEAPVASVLELKAKTPYPAPISAPVETDRAELLSLMRQRLVHQIPLVDENGIAVDLVTLDDLVPPGEALGLQAVLMAGGLGTRLRPLTEDLPKPMLPIGGRPLMERMVAHLRDAGIRKVNVTTHYKAEKIREHFGDGAAFGVEFNYVNEDRPLGTGGALGLLPVPTEPLLVINGDIFTQVDFRAILAYHRENRAEMTVAVRRFDAKVPYGVVECVGNKVVRLQEKPQLSFFVNAGIYLLEPSIYPLIPNGEHFHITDLIQWLLDAGRTVVSFPVREYWLDIGQHDDYAQAERDFQQGRLADLVDLT